jgi:hypothetical protein
MYEDPRFPNRKKKVIDEPQFGDKITDADRTEQGGEKAEEIVLPVTTYRILESPSVTLAEKPRAVELPSPISAPLMPELPSSAAAAPETEHIWPLSAAAPAVIAPTVVAAPSLRSSLSKAFSKENPNRVYYLAGVGLVIIFILVNSAILLFTGNTEGRYDLGTATSPAVGLKGKLLVEWDKKLMYRLTIEPDTSDRVAGFAIAVAKSPRPLAIEIHAQDAEGFVLCSKNILLKFDARNAPAPAAETTAAANDSANQPAPAIDFARLDATEAAREQGKDIFSNQIGPDGQVTAINAQGELPCAKKAYEKVSSWSFTPDFPSIAEQSGWLKPHGESKAGAVLSLPASAAHKKKTAMSLLPFTVEGDDVIVDFDLSRGVIETRGGKVFYMDRAAASAADSRWQDFPVTIHYHCDQSSSCILTHSGLGGLRTRLRR